MKNLELTPDQMKILDESINKNGVLCKDVVCMEECGELIQAISKLARRKAYDLHTSDGLGLDLLSLPGRELYNNLVEEMADVIICLNYLSLIYAVDSDDIDEWIDYKIERQRVRDEKSM